MCCRRLRLHVIVLSIVFLDERFERPSYHRRRIFAAGRVPLWRVLPRVGRTPVQFRNKLFRALTIFFRFFFVRSFFLSFCFARKCS